jgi:hypothetical protein
MVRSESRDLFGEDYFGLTSWSGFRALIASHDFTATRF